MKHAKVEETGLVDEVINGYAYQEDIDIVSMKMSSNLDNVKSELESDLESGLERLAQADGKLAERIVSLTSEVDELEHVSERRHHYIVEDIEGLHVRMKDMERRMYAYEHDMDVSHTICGGALVFMLLMAVAYALQFQWGVF